MDFVLKLEWPSLRGFMEAERIPLTDPTSGQTDLFVKQHENFQFYWNLRAGHAVSFQFAESDLLVQTENHMANGPWCRVDQR